MYGPFPGAAYPLPPALMLSFLLQNRGYFLGTCFPFLGFVLLPPHFRFFLLLFAEKVSGPPWIVPEAQKRLDPPLSAYTHGVHASVETRAENIARP